MNTLVSPLRAFLRVSCRSGRNWLALGIIGLILSVPTSSRGGASIAWRATGISGGTTQSASYSMTSAAGQTAIARAQTTSYIVRSGFLPYWVGPVVGPSLSIKQQGSFLVISWPLGFDGFVLEQRTNLTTGSWTTALADGPPVSVPLSGASSAAGFFRLRKP